MHILGTINFALTGALKKNFNNSRDALTPPYGCQIKVIVLSGQITYA